jgi:hypothetical protein
VELSQQSQSVSRGFPRGKVSNAAAVPAAKSASLHTIDLTDDEPPSLETASGKIVPASAVQASGSVKKSITANPTLKKSSNSAPGSTSSALFNRGLCLNIDSTSTFTAKSSDMAPTLSKTSSTPVEGTAAYSASNVRLELDTSKASGHVSTVSVTAASDLSDGDSPVSSPDESLFSFISLPTRAPPVALMPSKPASKPIATVPPVVHSAPSVMASVEMTPLVPPTRESALLLRGEVLSAQLAPTDDFTAKANRLVQLAKEAQVTKRAINDILIAAPRASQLEGVGIGVISSATSDMPSPTAFGQSCVVSATAVANDDGQKEEYIEPDFAYDLPPVQSVSQALPLPAMSSAGLSQMPPSVQEQGDLLSTSQDDGGLFVEEVISQIYV